MSALIIAANVTGPLPVSVTFQAPLDGPATFLFSGTAWTTNVNVLIGVQVLLDGNVIGTAKMFSNAASEHRTLPTQVMNANLEQGVHKITFQALVGTVTDANDFFSLSLLI